MRYKYTYDPINQKVKKEPIYEIDDLLDELDENGFIDFNKFKLPTRDEFEPRKECTCGKEKHGFTSHARWCDLYDPKKDGNGSL